MNSLTLPSLKASIPKVIGMPKPIKIPAPKIAHVSMAKPNGGGVIVQHHMTHGPKPQPFVFADPAKAMQHLKKIQTSQWRQPDQNVAQKTTHDLGLGQVA